LGVAKRRVVVIGLDGASWGFIDKMMELGVMPHTKRMLNKAARGVLDSYPPISLPAWASIATGVNPGKHGIFDFVYQDLWSGEQRLITTRDLEHPRIYEMLAMQGLEALVFNPIPSYPIIPLENLKIVSAALSPRILSYPKKMGKYAKGFPLYSEVVDAESRSGELDKGLFLELKLEKTYERVAVVDQALRQESWSLAWIMLQEPDNLLHFAYDEALSGHPRASKIFTLIDDLVKIGRDLADLLVLISDHGFRRYRRMINVNTILYKHGFAQPSTGQSWQKFYNLMSKGHSRASKAILHLPLYMQVLAQQLEKPRMKPLKKLVSRLLPFSIQKIGEHAFTLETNQICELAIPSVDIKASKAFMPTPLGYGVLVKNASDVEGIKNILLHSEGIADVKNRETIYRGQYIRRAPNLMIYFDHENGYAPGSNKIHFEIYTNAPFCSHHPHGIFCFVGDDVVPTNLGLINAWDASPTIMAYMGVPIPHDSDARIFTDPFNDMTHKDRRHNYALKWLIAKKVEMIRD